MSAESKGELIIKRGSQCDSLEVERMPCNPGDPDFHNVSMIDDKCIFGSSKVRRGRRIVGQYFQQGRDRRGGICLVIDLENVPRAFDCGSEGDRNRLISSHVAAWALRVDERD